MKPSELLKPDYLFEVSWEVCNKVGGIHTVIATKAKTLQEQYGDQYILIGPDVSKGGNAPEFIEDVTLFKPWKDHAINEGLKIRIGRWKISGNPIVILVDFTPFFTQKNEIFTNLWIKFKLDSLSGGWDYMEPALFGYAAAKVIECFYNHHLNNNDKIVAQFHEWMTGAGILYIEENIPQVATVFTTHATVLGRAIAGSGVAFYSLFDSFVTEKAANDFNVVSKNSLEKIAANTADCFTTVSAITAKECVKFLGKEPDVITPNGFDISILPNEHSFEKDRADARRKILSVAESLFNQHIPADSVLVINSGRYEYRNKGIDIFIDSLAALEKSTELDKTVLGIILVPAHQTGPRKDLLERIGKPDFNAPNINEVLTHSLQGAENDPVLKEVERVDLHNSVNDKVKIIFAPVYLDGNDGIFNMHYYDLLIGFDMAIFPSYYEPWGYTPLESIAYHIPSVTTNISGFGAKIAEDFKPNLPGISIITRTDTNDKEVVAEVSEMILDFTRKTEKELFNAREDAYNTSLNFLWKKLIEEYEKAYDFALKKSVDREDQFRNKPQVEPIALKEAVTGSNPVWRSILVEADFPKELAGLKKLIKNIWWSWNYEAEEVFEYIDASLWDRCCHNPVLFSRQLSFLKIEALSKDEIFLQLLNNAEKKFDEYVSSPKLENPHVAYFSMEYGLCSFIKLYSGGLGVLAGDFLKEASDEGLNIVAIGLLYKEGYFRQKFSVRGEQLAEADTQDFKNLPIHLVTKKDNTPVSINLFFPGRTVVVQIWKLNVGRVSLYLLDTDLEQNTDEDRSITAYLYDGNRETRLKQEILLGMGGIRALTALGIKPDVYHCNEGHASLISIERIQNLVKEENLSFEEAMEVVRASTLFTTHTSVPAANDLFSEELLRKYVADNTRIFNIDWEKFIGLGRMNPNDHNELFSMTCFAARLSQEINAVSKLHQAVSRNLLGPLWKSFKPGELHINRITNGVHYSTWASKLWQQFCVSALGMAHSSDISDKEYWKKIDGVPAKEIWNIRLELKRELITAIKNKLVHNAILRNNPERTFNIISNVNENALIIGFARRFVPYKRSGLLFTAIERLSKIIANTDKPVVFIFSGKAHPMDNESIGLINQLVDASSNAAFKNSVIFLENYDMDVARLLVQGVDVWLNTPERHTEASGTSGMKAALNGVLNFSVLDGWWSEAYNGLNGWMLSEDPVYKDHELQNQLDAETIYNLLENEIVPLFFDRDKEQIPVKWVEKIKTSLISIVPQFNMRRVLKEYNDNYYVKLYERVNRMKADHYSLAKSIVVWKKRILSHWNEIRVIAIEMPEKENFKGLLGDKISIKIVLNIGEMSINDIGVEIIISGDTLPEGYFVKEFSILNMQGQDVTFECIIRMEQIGVFDYAFRVFPKNENLPHRQDFDLVKWM